jgi:hypothetical protein
MHFRSPFARLLSAQLGEPVRIELALAARGAAAATLGVLLRPFTTLANVTKGEDRRPCAALLKAAAGKSGG